MRDNDKFFNILIAEDNDVSRELMAGILTTKGYRVYHAADGGSAIQVLQNNKIDMAYVDINMAPEGGFEFIKHLVVKGIKLPVVIVTGDTSGDILQQANAYGVGQIMQKPVQPDRLIQTTERILTRAGHSLSTLGIETRDTRLTPGQLMEKVIGMAEENWKRGRGQPYAALVTDAEGRILGQGANGIISRVDPTAHAEIMAIRQAAEKLDKTDLTGCVLYCTGEPTMMGKALIASTYISKVYYAIAHTDVSVTHQRPKVETEYTQLARDEALAMYREWEQAG